MADTPTTPGSPDSPDSPNSSGSPDSPCDDDSTTTPPTLPAGPGRPQCPVCWTPFTPTGRQRYCTDNCRKTAWSRRHIHTTVTTEPVVPQQIRRRDVTIYSCPSCDTRYHGQQWCHDCNQPCTRIGLGGTCPHCAEPVAITDLIDTPNTSPIR